MFPIGLIKTGEQVLKSYCKNRKRLFKVIDKPEGFKVISSHTTWIGKLLRQGQIMDIDFNEEEKRFYLYLDPNIIYELYFEEIFDLISFIDKVRDKNQKRMKNNGNRIKRG